MTSRTSRFLGAIVIALVVLSNIPFVSLRSQQTQTGMAGAVLGYFRVLSDTTRSRGTLTDVDRALIVDPRPHVDLAAAMARRPAQVAPDALHPSNERILPPGLKHVRMLTPADGDACRADWAKCLANNAILVSLSTPVVNGNAATIAANRKWLLSPDPDDAQSKPSAGGDSWLFELTQGAGGWQVVKATRMATAG